MTCASCVAQVENAARSVRGVRDCRVNLARGRAELFLEPDQNEQVVGAAAAAIASAGYPAAIEAAGPTRFTPRRNDSSSRPIMPATGSAEPSWR